MFNVEAQNVSAERLWTSIALLVGGYGGRAGKPK